MAGPLGNASNPARDMSYSPLLFRLQSQNLPLPFPRRCEQVDFFSAHSIDGVTLPQPMIDDSIELHRAEACRVHAVSVSRMFRPDLANENLSLWVV